MVHRSNCFWLLAAVLAGGAVLGSMGCSSGGVSPDASGAAGTTGTAGTGAAGTTGIAGTTGGGGTTGAAGTGADDRTDASADGAAPPGDAGAMTLTAAGLVMVDGGLVFPAAASAPMNQSPELAWSNAPAGTLSFAITLRNLSTSNTQWVIWNILPTRTMVAAHIPRVIMPLESALQKSASGDTIGYEGPGGDVVEDYELQVWALKVARLSTMSPNDMYATGLPAQRLDSATIRAKGTRNGL